MATSWECSRGSADNSDTLTVTTTHTRRFVTQQLLSPDIGLQTVDWHCYSAPQSRSGSFKKPRRTGLADATPRSSLPSLEDSITAKLLELQQLEADDCRVVREFVTSEGGIVHRGDSFRRNKETTKGSSGDRATERDSEADRQRQSAGPAATQRRNDARADAVQIAADTVACRVVIMGDHGVGKSALLQQLMTSHYLAAMNTCSFGQYSIIIIVPLNLVINAC